MKRTILIVDDHPLVRQGVRGTLDGNYTVCGEASDGAEAVERASALKPDLVILDFSMPVMNGFDAARQIRRLLPNTKILMLSMHQSPQFEREAKAAGADEAIGKTSPREDFLKAIDDLLQTD